jgi:chromosome partitioning protein
MAPTETTALASLWKTKERRRFGLCWRCGTLIDVKSVIAIANQKGGVGKTTSAAALGVIMSRAGWPVHLIDMDPQADLTTSFGLHDKDGLLYQSLSDQEGLPIVRLSDKLTLTPSSIDMSRGESSFLAAHGREFLLQGALNKTTLPQDATVIIDCPPSLGVLTVNCLAAAQKLIVTVHPGGLEMKALFFLQQTVDEIRERINKELEILGVILTNCDMRKRVTEEARREIRRRYDVLGLVRQDSRLSYATGSGSMLSLMDTHGFAEYGKVAELLTKKVWKGEPTPA